MMDISPSFSNNTSDPLHVLIQLSSWQWNRFSANSIHLTGRTICNKHVYYSGIEYGSNISIAVELQEHTTIMFSAMFLTHRQTMSQNLNKDKNIFVNFGAYGNHKLLCHMKKSFYRSDKNNNI